VVKQADERAVERALASDEPGIKHFAAMISPAGDQFMEQMAGLAQKATRRHFGKTISLYVPLYLSNHCSGGCAYCGFASDRKQARRRLERSELTREFNALRKMGFEDVLLLTGERTKAADFEYLLSCTSMASQWFHNVTVEAFAMTVKEYEQLGAAGCTGITIYQETYDAAVYRKLHRWGEKRDYLFRLEAPGRALAAGLRTVGLGVLLGLADPIEESICLYQHAANLKKEFWQAGVLLSFPRICAQFGGYQPEYPVDERLLARIVFAFRLCFPDMPLVMSTREKQEFRDGIAGIGISRMSVASRTTVGGYSSDSTGVGQFDVGDTRDVKTFCRMLRRKKLEPVFKNWDSAFVAKGCPR